jgi:hypothetical protein
MMDATARQKRLKGVGEIYPSTTCGFTKFTWVWADTGEHCAPHLNDARSILSQVRG